jgi:carboxymethylenebutenolidase
MRRILPCLLMCLPLYAQAPVAKVTLPPEAEGAKAALKASPRHGEWVDVALADGTKLSTWVVYPEGKGKAGVVVMIHEIFGLSDWVRATADRLAAEGFIVLAPDLLSGMGPKGGGTDSLGDDVGKVIRTLTPAQVAARLDAVRAWGLALPSANGKCGVLGFCWGGGMSFQYAATQPTLQAAVVYYGPSPDPATLAKVKAPILGCYGGDDARITAGLPVVETEMKRLGKAYAVRVFEGAGHGFMRQQSGREGANAKAAASAWAETVAFFKAKLG